MTTEEFRSDASIIKNISTFGEEAAEALEKLEKDLFPHSNYGTCSAVLTVH